MIVVKNYIHPNLKVDYTRISQSLKDEWNLLCNHYLPVVPEDSIWRLNRASHPDDPDQGWKIHISATILSANEVFKAVAPLLSSSGILFKAPCSLEELSKINAGIYYGYSQIGKFITVYPETPEEAVKIAGKLHNLTRDFSGPIIPYDNRFRHDSCVYYRYGAFKNLEIQNQDGSHISALRSPSGNMIPDTRKLSNPAAKWVSDPFSEKTRRHKKATSGNGAEAAIEVYEMISQRGKGGVYRALDFSVSPFRPCILKAGRKHGETDWDSRDGYWRVKHESEVLTSMMLSGINAPKVYTTFNSDSCFYLAIEFIKGKDLHKLIEDNKGGLPINEALEKGIQLTRLLQTIHSAGWVWRDCKPRNLILNDENILCPLDFEGACRIDIVETMPWGTVGYAPPEGLIQRRAECRVPEDLYALGATLHHMLSGRVPGEAKLQLIGVLRKRIPRPVREVIHALLDSNPQSRPDISTVLKTLTAFAP